MNNLYTVISILMPLFIGFCIKLPKKYLKLLDYALNYLVYMILLFIGLGLSQVQNLTQELNYVLIYALILFGLLILFNIIFLILLDKIYPKYKNNIHATQTKRQKINLLESSKQISILIIGAILGWILPHTLLPPESSGKYALMCLIGIVGIQMRSNNIALKSIFLNKYGLKISLVFMLSCGLAGLIFSMIIPDVSWQKGLALSSGYGWYSLSGIVMTQAYGATWGSVALLNDLLREFFALIFIPSLMMRSPASAIGVGGATSLDFTLPIIQKSGGLNSVPIAISFGFIINVLSPFLMVLFSSLN